MPTLMLSVPGGYRLGKRLSTSARSELYAGVRAADGMAVVLKRYRAGRADRERCARREHELLRRVAAAKRIPRALELDLAGEDPVLVLDALPGLPLASLLQGEVLSLDALIAIGLQLADTLEQIHAARVIHRDVTPRNVLVERDTWAVSLIDFGIACELGAAQATDPFEGTPHYVAPEQTGWLNRGCDARSDLYSLGATLYHAATGSPPFPELDAAELMHAHLARVPRSPSELRADLPAPLADLVLKLLRKEPEERYQRARALHADLSALREQLQRHGCISGDFELGSAEIPERPRFPRKLHGRAAELEVLRSAYARSAAGSVGLVLIAGDPGAGKSALVETLRPEMTRAGAYVACAKFDPFRDRPYAGWAEALGALVQQLLVESTDRLERCKADLEGGLGSIAQALIDLVPDLAFLLGEVQPVPPLGPAQTQTRLALALQRFSAAVATPAHPLVLFLDDLQWSDAGSRALLEELLSNLQGAALLLIGAYRASDVGRDHPLAALCERLEGRGVSIERIGLGAVDAEAAESMLADALERPRAELRGFAACVARKTGNVPFLIQQFVLHMHSLGLVRFAARHGWTWNDAAIAAADIPDGAVALMVSKLERLDRAARELIEFASCVGDSFDVELLADLSGRPRESIEAPLYVLAEEGLIAPAPTGFRFVHGRIREAAQSLLTPDALSRLHWDTGRLLLERTPEAQRGVAATPRLFEMVEHLNRGRSHVENELRVPLIELNLQAGKRALRTGAGSTAGGYLAVARELFAPTDWQTRRELGLDLYFESAESAFQSSAYDDALAFLSTLEQRDPSALEYARIETQRLRVLALVQQPEAVLRHALRALRRLGLHWSENPSRLRSRLALLRVRVLLRGRNAEDALRPAAAPDPRGLAQLLAQVGATFLRVGVHHAVQANSFMMRRFLRHGYTRSPGFTVSGHALYYLMFTGDAERTRRLVESVRRLNERVPDPVYTLRAELTIQAGVDPWIMRRRRAVGSMDAVAAVAREIGDREGEFQSRFLRTAYLALAGDPVLEVEQSMSELAAAVERCGALYPEPEKTHGVYRLLRSGAHDLERRLAESDAWIARHPTSTEPYLRTFWLLVLCVFGRHDLAFAQSETMGERLFRVVPFVHVADHTFYRGLAAAALAAGSPRRRGSRHRRALVRCRKLLRRWARNGPDFVHMARILEAEQARLRGRHDVARSTLEHAAREALEQQFVHHAALAHERRASLLVALRRETEAGAALEEAAALYRSWGATARVEQLESRSRT